MVLWPDPSSWNPFIWALHALAVVYLFGFFGSWARFRRRERMIRAGSEDAMTAFNRDLERFPWSFYAKMLGRHRYEDPASPGEEREEGST